MIDKYHTMFFNACINDESVPMRIINMLAEGYRLFWFLGDDRVMQNFHDAPSIDQNWSLWLMDGDLVKTPEEALFFFMAPFEFQRTQRVDSLPYIENIASWYNEREYFWCSRQAKFFAERFAHDSC